MKPALPTALIGGGRYKPLKWIGAGGMQNVFLATDKYLRRDVALKMPKDDSASRRFQRSAVVSARINHANVAKTLDYLDEESGSYLIEEFVDGLDLDRITTGFLPYIPPSTAARVFHSLAKGLAASHHVGVVHRDLKPSNIMVLGGLLFQGVKITDFGIAKMAEEEIGEWADVGGKNGTSSRTVLGAIPYMAPEAITNFRDAAKASDVWAVGAIVYELLSSQKPFGGGLLSVAKIMAAEPPPKPANLEAVQFRGLGKQLYELILRCLAKNPNNRPDADSLARECEVLCYSLDSYETGSIKKRLASNRGFLESDVGRDLFYHRDSIYGDNQVDVGTRIWFGRHPGGGNDRAFPIVKLKTIK